MNILENHSLQKYNSFGIPALARNFAEFTSVAELSELLSLVTPRPPLILGGGSNILFTHNVDGWVLKNSLRGIRHLGEDDEFTYVQAGAGENWHQFVLYCLQQNWAGLENLALIPGNCGASPMQNIGAYGVEIKDVFHRLEALHIESGSVQEFNLADCHFGYRDSVFKNKYRGQFVILQVTYRLRKIPVINASYGAIGKELEKLGIAEPGIRDIARAVVNIRSSKLPDPAVVGNAGSFFKNPAVPEERFKELTQLFPGMPGYANADGTVKLAAGWLIEQCGWKGYRKGDAGCYPLQALVLVNYGNASGAEILELSEQIIQSVGDKFGVSLEREVNIV